jgi:hypothetical protein
MIQYDAKAAFIWLPNFLKYNSPESPNVVRSWAASLELLPECDMKRQLCRKVKGFVKDLPKAFVEALAKDFDEGLDEVLPKTMPNQEQEQEQEQKQEPPMSGVNHDTPREREMSEDEPTDSQRDEPVGTRTSWPPQKRFPRDFPRTPPEWFIEWGRTEAPETDIVAEWKGMLDHEYAESKTHFWACARTWMRNAPKFHRNGARASPRYQPQETAEEKAARQAKIIREVEEGI